MKITRVIPFFVLLLIAYAAHSRQQPGSLAAHVVTAEWVKERLKKQVPRLILSNESLAAARIAVKNEAYIKAYYDLLYRNAEALLNAPLLERKLEGRRLLSVSREAVSRIGTLSIVYAISKEARFLKRADAELLNVCQFSDWNPSHFLDVGEMAYGVAIGSDWTLGDLPRATKTLIRKALIEKALQPSQQQNQKAWVFGTNNWNQVCHGGMVAAAVAIADQEPALAAEIISRAVQNIPAALRAYAPAGAYPEGASYWAYGTSYTLLTISALESAFGTSFGIAASPGFLQSALFVKKLAGPSGLYYNYFDSGSGGNNSLENQELLSWFARKTNNSAYFDAKELKMLLERSRPGQLSSKLNGAALVWLLQAKDLGYTSLPQNYKGEGLNPVAIFGPSDAFGFFLGAKGGAANMSHGNMDAGSFVFELNGVRWSVDLGMQDYSQLENILGSNGLWNAAQSSPRWTLLSKNNFGHSTLRVDEDLHLVQGFAAMAGFKDDPERPEVSFDLSNLFRGKLSSAIRTFRKTGPQELQVTDQIQFSDQLPSVTWMMMTQADAELIKGGFLLKQNGRQLKVILRQPLGAEFKVIYLNPPPLDYDMKVPGLKRLEIHLNAASIEQSAGKILVSLSGD